MYNKIKHIKTELMAFCLIFALLVSFGSCSSDDDDTSGEVNLEIAGNKLIKNLPEREKILKNPMNGWVIYSGLGDGLSDTFWEDYDNFQSSEGTVKVSDYATTLFIRASWTDFNPEEGVYAWHEGVNTKAAQRFKMLVNGAMERDLKLAFAFIVDSQDKAYDFTPSYVKNAEGITGYETKTGSKTVWSPYPDNKVFQQYYERFIKDFAQQYNDPDVVQFISGTGLGKWGEYHTVRYSTEDNAPKLEVFEWVTNLYSKVFDKVPIVMYYHRWMGSRNQWDGSKYDPDSDGMVKSAVEKGYSLRNDAFGMKSYYASWERNITKRYKHKRPIITEGGWVRGNTAHDISKDGYKNYAEVRAAEFTEAKGANANMMDLRYSKNLPIGETYSWFNDAFGLLKEFIQEGGYRLYPSVVSLPETIENGKSIEIGHRWNNLGWGYFPTNLPQWKDKYKIAFSLLDKASLEPKYVFLDQSSDLSYCTKGSPQNYILKQNISNVTAGNYIWAVGVVDTTKDNNIGIEISAKGDVTSDGWLQLFEVSAH